MAGYYFVKSNGHLFRLTKKAYQTWIIDSANRLTHKKSPAKLKNYGTDLGEISDFKSSKEFEFSDFIKLSKLYSTVDTTPGI